MMRGFGWVSRWWRAGRRVSVGIGTLSLVLGPVGLAAWGNGYERVRVPLSSGGAWLASIPQSIVTLVDGASEQVVGSVWVPEAVRGPGVSVVQSGSAAYVVNAGRGTVARVDAATFETSSPVKFGDGSGSLEVLTSKSAVYVLDGGRRLVSVADPTSLRLRGEPLSLAARPGPGQSVVDSAGRLWVVDRDRGGLTWFDGGKRVRPQVGDPSARLVLVQGRPVLVDPLHARVGALSSDGAVDQWSCLDLQAADQVQVLGSASSQRVFAAVAGTGTLLVSAVDRDDCGMAVPVGKPGDRFGPLVESAGFVFVPNWSSGNTVVVDVNSARVAATLPVGKPGARLELVAKDGFVFYNDLDGDRAGVIRLDGGLWRLGAALQKFDRANVAKGILTPERDATGSLLDSLEDKPSPSPSTTKSPSQYDGPPPPDEPGNEHPPPRGGPSSPTDPPTDPSTEPPPTSPPPSTPPSTPPGQPKITDMVASDRTPGVGQKVTFSAKESVVGDVATWTWSVLNADTGAELGSENKPAGESFSWTFDDEGSFRVRLTVAYQGLDDQAEVTVTVGDHCTVRRVDSAPIELTGKGAHELKFEVANCFVARQVTVAAKDWINVSDTSVTVPAGGDPPTVTINRQGGPPVDGVNENAVTVRLVGGNAVTFDVHVNLEPRFISKPSCSGGGDVVEFGVAIADGDLRGLDATIKIGGRSWPLRLVIVSGEGDYANFEGKVPPDEIPAGEEEFQVVAVDSGGMSAWAKGFACW